MLADSVAVKDVYKALEAPAKSTEPSKSSTS